MNEKKYNALRKAIQDGINSGIAENFDPKTHLKELKKKEKSQEFIKTEYT